MAGKHRAEMGAGASALNVATTSNDDISATIFATRADKAGLMSVDALVALTKEYFDSQPTTQPEQWCRTMVSKYAGSDGALDQAAFALAIEDLRRC